MDDAQQNGDATAPDTGNVMDRVLETFDGLADNATAAIGTGVSKIGAAGAGLVDKAGTLAGDISDSISGDSPNKSWKTDRGKRRILRGRFGVVDYQHRPVAKWTATKI